MQNGKKSLFKRLREASVEDIMCIVLAAYICFLCSQLYTACSSRGNVDGAISKVEQQQQSVGTEVGRTGDAINQAETAIGAANGRFEQIQGCIVGGAAAASRITNGVIQCEKIVDECRSLAGENKRILAGVATGNRNGTQVSETAGQ